jgi:opacity protein-like surface antigen
MLSLLEQFTAERLAYMQRVSICVFFLIFVASLASFAQDTPKFEVFAGYSYLHVDTQGVSFVCPVQVLPACPIFHAHANANGWNAAAQYNLTSALGLEANIAGHYNTPLTASFAVASASGTSTVNISGPRQHIYDFLFGPVFSYRKHSYTPWAHALFGDEHVGFSSVQLPLGLGTVPAPPSQNFFAFALGGGLDFKVARHLLVRAGEFDYQFVNASINNRGHQNDFRFSAGVVFIPGSTAK